MLKTQELQINIGPQHPSTHGVFRLVVTVDGETIVDLKPVFGYLHRNHEQLGEVSTYIQSMPFTDRLDYFNSMANNFGLALAVEKLAGIEVPQRANYIRVLMAELTRILNHATAVGFMINDMGAWQTPLAFGMREREKILDLFEMASGARMRSCCCARWVSASCPRSWPRPTASPGRCCARRASPTMCGGPNPTVCTTSLTSISRSAQLAMCTID